MFGPSATAGMLAENERIDRRRSELARAFTDFRQANPHASLDELQMFIDQSYGPGSMMYGAPSRGILEGVSRQNQERKLQFDAMQNLDRLTKQAQVQGNLMAQAERIAGMTDDPTQAYAQFSQMFGNNPLAQQMIKPEMFAGLQNRANADFVKQYLDVATRAVENGQDITNMFPGMSKTRVELLKSNAELEARKRKEDRDREIETREIDRAAKLTAAGVDYSLPGGLDPNTPVAKSIMDTATRLGDARRRQLINQESDELRTKSPELQSRILAGDRDGARQIVQQRLKALFPNREPTVEEVEGVMSSIVAGAQGIQTQNRQRLLQEIDKQATDTVRQQREMLQNQTEATLGDKKLAAQRFGSGPVGQITVDTIKQLKLPLSGALLNAIGEKVKSSEFQRAVSPNGQTPTSDSIMSALQSDPTIGQALREAMSVEGQVSRERESRRQQSSLFDIQKAEDFVSTYQQNLTRSAEQLSTRLDSSISVTLADGNIPPQAKRQRLQQEKDRLVMIQRDAERELSARLRGAHVWQDVGGRPFTGEDAERLATQLRQTTERLVKRIDDALQMVPAAPSPQDRTMAPRASAPQDMLGPPMPGSAPQRPALPPGQSRTIRQVFNDLTPPPPPPPRGYTGRDLNTDWAAGVRPQGDPRTFTGQ
jgi:hypothetical protein